MDQRIRFFHFGPQFEARDARLNRDKVYWRFSKSIADESDEFREVVVNLLCRLAAGDVVVPGVKYDRARLVF